MDIVVLVLAVIVVVTFLALPSLPVRTGVLKLFVSAVFTTLVAAMVFCWIKWQYPDANALQSIVGVGIMSVLVLFVSYGLAGDVATVPTARTTRRHTAV
jgi:hypothetical protein